MASNVRNQLENWLKTIEVNGSVFDVGGLHIPVKGRTKTWEVYEYSILDIKKEYKGRKADVVWNMNLLSKRKYNFDNVFCLEVLSQLYDLMNAFRNFNLFLKTGGKLFISTHFLFPMHQGTDYTRLTKQGVLTLLEKNKFKVLSMQPRMTCNFPSEQEFVKSECKVNLEPGQIGYLIEAQKVYGLE